jgi:hypothetical protein
VCEPAFTADTARFVAGLRGNPEALAEVTTRNFFRCSRKPRCEADHPRQRHIDRRSADRQRLG